MRNLTEIHEKRKSAWKIIFVTFLIIFLLSFAYAIIRYNVFKKVGVEHIPLYIFNKAISLTAVILIGISFLLGPLSRFWPKTFVSKLYLRKYFGVFGFGIAALHGVISLLLFNPSYYPKFFIETGKLTLVGELSMLFGVLATFIFSAVSITSLPAVEQTLHKKQWLFIQRLGYLAFFLVMLHVTVMGYGGWFNPSGWPGGLFPITLLAFVVIAFVLLMRIIVIIFPERRK